MTIVLLLSTMDIYIGFLSLFWALLPKNLQQKSAVQALHGAFAFVYIVKLYK
jgi:hypothetical protein